MFFKIYWRKIVLIRARFSDFVFCVICIYHSNHSMQFNRGMKCKYMVKVILSSGSRMYQLWTRDSIDHFWGGCRGFSIPQCFKLSQRQKWRKLQYLETNFHFFSIKLTVISRNSVNATKNYQNSYDTYSLTVMK